MSNPNATQQDPMTAYSQLDSGQRSNIAREFIQRFRGTNDQQAQQFAQLDPNNVSPQQLAQMHEYAAQKQPGILRDVMNHPIVTGVLAAFAAHEMKKHFG